MYLSSRQGMYIVAAHFYTLEEEEEEKVLCWLSEDEEGKRKRATSWCHLKPTLVLKKNRQKKREREERKVGGWVGLDVLPFFRGTGTLLSARVSQVNLFRLWKGPRTYVSERKGLASNTQFRSEANHHLASTLVLSFSFCFFISSVGSTFHRLIDPCC